MKHLLPVFALFLFPACAAMQQQYVDTVCNEEGAYQQGYNDAGATTKMDSSFASMCASDQDKIRRAYRQGFDKGVAQKTTEQPLVVVHEHEVQPPENSHEQGWHCIDKFGEQACGYDCKEDFGLVKCAHRRRDNCVAAFGVIKCGLHCREEFGEIKCDRYE